MIRRATVSSKPRTQMSMASRARRAVHLPVRFEFAHDNARRVFVVGSFNDWRRRATPMRRVATGRWMAEVPLKPGRYEYRFVVDGRPVHDPFAARFAPGRSGGLNAILHV